MLERIQAGATAAALTLAAGAFAADWCPAVAVLLFVLTGLILVLTFANKLPLLHLLPGFGAPRLKATFEQLPAPTRDPAQIMIRIGLSVPTRLPDAVLNFLAPADIDLYNAKDDGSPSGRGRMMLPTDEPLTPGVEFSDYWAHNVDLRHGSGLMNFVLTVPKPRVFNVRLRVGSERLYKGEYVADFQVVRAPEVVDRDESMN